MELYFDSRPTDTLRRIAALDQYMSSKVLSGGEFVCPTYPACRSSHAGDFYEGQLHHVGAHYDARLEGRPFRIAVVGQEYGNAPSKVTRLRRGGDVARGSGLQSRFRRTGPYPARNSHMRGTTSVLRLLFGAGLGTDHEAEFVTFGTTRVHMFEAFALTNFLLCSAIDAGSRGHKGQHGRSTRIMQRNCAAHFVAAMEILEPTVLIIQGIEVRQWLNHAAKHLESLTDHLEVMSIGNCRALVASFTHPAAPTRDNWGTNARRPYLLEVVAPTVQAIHKATLGSAAV